MIINHYEVKMRLLSKKEIENYLGKYGLFSGKAGNACIDKVKYIGGISQIDNMLAEKKITAATPFINLTMRPKGLEITFMLAFENFRIGLLYNQMNFWSIKRQADMKIKKNRSIIGRALIGSLLFGPVGTILGGMSGIKDKEVNINDVDNLLLYSITLNDTEHILIFSCKDKHLQSVYSFFKENFNNLFKDISELEKANNSTNDNTSIDQLMKLKELLDANLIDMVEFELEKRKLIG